MKDNLSQVVNILVPAIVDNHLNSKNNAIYSAAIGAINALILNLGIHFKDLKTFGGGEIWSSVWFLKLSVFNFLFLLFPFLADNILLLQPFCTKAQFLSGKAKVDLIEKVAGTVVVIILKDVVRKWNFSLSFWIGSILLFYIQMLWQSSTLASPKWWSRKCCPCCGTSWAPLPTVGPFMAGAAACGVLPPTCAKPFMPRWGLAWLSLLPPNLPMSTKVSMRSWEPCPKGKAESEHYQMMEEKNIDTTLTLLEDRDVLHFL